MIKYGVKENSPTTDVRKIPKYQAYFFCFNMIVGYAFILGLSSVFQQIGNWFLLLIIICGSLAFIVGLGYAKLSRHYDTNGGVFVYTYKAFGKKTAYVYGWIQYIKSPATALSSILGMVWAFKTVGGIGKDGVYPWWLYLIMLLIFFIIFVTLYFGYTGGKAALIILSILKWSLFIVALGLALYWIKDYSTFTKNIFDNGYKPKSWTDSYHIFLQFSPAILTFFFAYGGFEDFASMANDFENPKSTLPKAIIFVFITSSIFYLIVFYLILGSLGPSNKYGLDPNGLAVDQNPINNLLYKTFGSFSGVMALTFGVILGVSQVANKSCSRLQVSWVLARQLSPLASSGFLPGMFAKRNKYGQFQNSITFDAIGTFVFITVYIVISTVIYKGQNAGRLSGALNIYTFIAFLIYTGTLASLLKLSSTKSSIKLNIWEKIMYIFGLMVLIIILVLYVVTSMLTAGGFLELGLQLITIASLLFIGVIIYVIGHYLKWHNHELTHNYYLDHIEESIIPTTD